MPKIPIDDLRCTWQQQGFWGPWRQLLREGSVPGETFFEFGVMPEEQKKYGDYRVVLDHEVFVRLCPADNSFQGPYVIRPDDRRAGYAKTMEGRNRTFFVTEREYAQLMEDARQIYDEYKDEARVCFWSIPNKWFENLFLIRFITEKIVDTDEYRNRPRPRDTWFWP